MSYNTPVALLRELCGRADIAVMDCISMATYLSETVVKEFPHSVIYVACIKSFGNCFVHPLAVKDKNGLEHLYTHHAVVVCEGKVFDPEHDYIGVPLNKYLMEAIIESTPEFRFDTVLTYGLQELEAMLSEEVRSHYKPRR